MICLKECAGNCCFDLSLEENLGKICENGNLDQLKLILSENKIIDKNFTFENRNLNRLLLI